MNITQSIISSFTDVGVKLIVLALLITGVFAIPYMVAKAVTGSDMVGKLAGLVVSCAAAYYAFSSGAYVDFMTSPVK